MATYRVVYWQEIPSQVDAKEGGLKHKQPLSARFQQLINMAAAQRKLDSADDYIKAWARGEPETRPGSAREVAEAVAAEFESRFDVIRASALKAPH
jgi:hypothetical protein